MPLTAQYPGFDFQVDSVSRGSSARTGRIITPHGVVETPNFYFCGTKGAVRSATPGELVAHGVQAVLSNTYHLMLQPGAPLVADAGGLHGFMGWDRPIFTDSGGFQVFCMGQGSVSDEIKRKGKPRTDSAILAIGEEGVKFRSYIDGSEVMLTPERSIQVQSQLGADMIACFDECTPFHVEKKYTEDSMEMSHRWGVRCVEEFNRHAPGRQSLFGIMQGGVFPDLRARSAAYMNETPFFGNAIGGSLGDTKGQMYDVVAHAASLLPGSRPCHLLGIGHPEDILECVKYGIDTFDCVTPTRVARHGLATSKVGKLNLANARFKADHQPIDPRCDCSTCGHASRAYLHHLFSIREPLAGALVAIHNIRFMMTLMAEIRQAIREDSLESLTASYREVFQADRQHLL